MASGRGGRFVLASRSPQRVGLLTAAGFAFDSDPADIDETLHPASLKPAEVAMWAASEKARTVAARRPEDVVLAADTIVALGDRLLGKPPDAKAASEMLHALSGSTHKVITGIVIRHDAIGLKIERQVVSTVQMNDLSADQIAAYVATGEWRGKAGGYGIQHRDTFVRRLEGCHTNIIGLPMTTVREMLESAGIAPEK